MKRLRHWFTIIAKWTARISGQPLAFVTAVAVIVVWAITGPMFGYSDTWQLVINTGTTIVTFLMVFLIQNTQNRDTGAIQTKLDELIRAIEGRTTRSWIWRSSTRRRSSTFAATTPNWRRKLANRSKKECGTRIATTLIIVNRRNRVRQRTADRGDF